MHAAWIWLTVVITLKLLHCVMMLACTLRFLRGRWEPRSKSTGTHEVTVGPVTLYVLVPLLREQRALPQLFAQFAPQLRTVPHTYLVLVTTEREVLEPGPRRCHRTTMDVLRELLAGHPEMASRVLHYHFPGYNSVVAEQLNYAVSQLVQRAGSALEGQYLAVYNADSVIDEKTLITLQECARSRLPVMQQSSLFLANVPFLLKMGRYYTAMHGIYQSCWTLQHEIPRYLFARRFFSILPRWIELCALVHCVTHGLLIRLDVISRLNGFPVLASGGEDLALGLLLRAHGYEVVPIPALENSETPERAGVLWRQLAGWFLATLGYWWYWRLVPSRVLRSNAGPVVAITILGILDSFKWLTKGFLVLAYLALSLIAGHVALGFTLYAAYVYVPFAAVLWLWKHLPPKSFPPPPWRRLAHVGVLFWTVLIVRSGPPVLGLWWAIKLGLGMPFVKPKTERE